MNVGLISSAQWLMAISMAFICTKGPGGTMRSERWSNPIASVVAYLYMSFLDALNEHCQVLVFGRRTGGGLMNR